MVERSLLAERNDVSSIPRALTFPTRFGSSTSGVPWRTTAFITVHQHTASSRATTATGMASSPTWRVASAPARNVSTARGATCSVPSVQVFAGQSGSAQRHRRFSHTSRTVRPKHGRSLMSTRRRSWASARTPQVAQPATSAVVSTVTVISAGNRSTLSTRKPSSPSMASAWPIASSIVRGPPRVVVEQPQRWRDLWPRWWTSPYVTLPSSTRRAT